MNMFKAKKGKFSKQQQNNDGKKTTHLKTENILNKIAVRRVHWILADPANVEQVSSLGLDVLKQVVGAKQ